MTLNSFTPAVGNTFDIIDWPTNGRSGTFSSVQLPILAAGEAWDTSNLYTTGVLIVIQSSLTADYNHNGAVDGADYAIWRNNQGTTHTLPNDPVGGTIGVAQYNQWRAHFGQTAGSGAGAIVNAAVPEPATLLLLMFAAAGLCLRRGRSA